MKKIINVLSAFVMSAALLTGCGGQEAPINQGHSADKVNVVCTTFPQYDWVMKLLGEEAEAFDVTLLVKNSADIHNYQPSAQDMISMKEADLFVYVGGESDAWVKDLMNADASFSDKSVSLVDALGDDHEHDHNHEHVEDHGHESLDEHVWLSLENAEILCQYISGRLCELAPEHENAIRDNTISYIEQLHALSEEYRTVVDASAHNPLIFGDRFPFRYLIEDYDLEYYAAFAGCNAEVEAGFDTIIHLAGKVDELDVPCVLVIDGSDKSLAETILNTAESESQEILEMDSMQSVSWEDILQGANYIDIMKANLEVLRKALG